MAVVRRMFVAVVVALICASPLSAQEPTGSVRGQVVDSTTQQPIPDVRVSIEGTRHGTITREDGTFLISGIPVGTQRVRVSRIGRAPQVQVVTVSANQTPELQFALPQRVVALQEVITTGYGTQRRLAITGSVATIDADAANRGVVANVSQMIQGRAAGVQITQNSGEPGAGAQIRIRGGTSISASNEPLYVIDGIPIENRQTEAEGITLDRSPSLPRNPMNFLNPSDIGSISILKDAAATAIYGSRGANGVILIETKKGGSGPGMDYEFYAGRSSPKKYLNVLNGAEYRTFIQDQVTAGALTAASVTSLGTANTDWERAVTKSSNSFNHNLAFAGGSAATQYRASINYMNQEGIVLNNGFKRYQARLNGTHAALDGKLRLGLNLNGSHIINKYIENDNTTGFEGGVFINMINFNPTQPVTVVDPSTGASVFYENGAGSQSVRNPVALLEQIQDLGTTDRTLANVSAAYDLLSSLTAKVNIGVDRSDGNRSTYFPRISPVGAAAQGRARQVELHNQSKTLQTLLTFHPQFSGDQTFEIIGGYEFNNFTYDRFGAEARGFLTDAFGYDRLEAGSTLVPSTSYREDSRLVAFFSNANWSYKDTYFLTGVLRREGSSKFGAGNKWAVFPAISGSWRLTESGFVPHGPFSNLALRASWGKQGNEAVPAYASLITLSADGGSRYVFGDQAVIGVSPTQNPNPNLKWEQTAQTNLALDYGFLNNRFNGSLEYYVKNTSDLLLRVTVPQPAVASDRLENIGKIRNKGVEFSLNGLVIDQPSRNWTAGLVFAAERNTVVDLGGRSFLTTADVSGQGQSGQRGQVITPGQPIGTFYGPQYVGLNPAGQQLFNQYQVTRDTTGKELTRKLIGQTTSPGGDDKVVIGNANPDFTLGFNSVVNFGNFDFNFLINSSRGQDVFNNTALVYATKGNAKQSKNFLASALTDGVGINEPQIYSSRWIEDGSFTRLQNVTLGYTFDLPKFAGSARNTRVYLSGDNLMLLTGYSGYDPEVYTDASINNLTTRGVDYLHYPRPRTITAGARVAF